MGRHDAGASKAQLIWGTERAGEEASSQPKLECFETAWRSRVSRDEWLSGRRLKVYLDTPEAQSMEVGTFPSA